MVTGSQRRTGRSLAAAVAVLVLAGAVAPIRSAVAQEAPATPGVLATPAATLACEGDAAPKPASTFTISSADSAARYRSQEQLASIGANEAVGQTNAVIGNILFDASGMPLACSRFDVDLRTLKSDEARRDNYLYRNTLETERYPLATFVLSAVEGLDQPLAEGQETTFRLIGNLTMHGVTKLVAWETKAKLEGDKLTGSAATTFAMPDFAIEPPTVGPVVSIDNIIKLEVDVTAQRAQ